MQKNDEKDMLMLIFRRHVVHPLYLIRDKQPSTNNFSNS